MTLTLSAPGKTFLVGEYAVLAGGPALVLGTAPRFELRVTRGETAVVGIPERAPAARWLRARAPLLENYRVEFVDPYAGAGGLGASGAQFLMTHAFTTFLQQSFGRALEGPDLAALWRDYQTLTESRGSGADLLAQSAGGIAEIDMGLTTARTRVWPYPDVAWTLVRTHQKVPTHEHLRTLDAKSLSLFVRPAQDCVQAFGTAPSQVFVGKLREFTNLMIHLELCAASTANLVDRLAAETWCLFAKGCGALGADVVLILHPAAERERVKTYLRKQSLSLLATDADLSHGLEVKWT